MSVEATTWAWKQPTRSSGQRLVLLALADHASCHDDEEGFTCWPKIATISEMAGIGDSTVRAHIDALCDDGLLKKVERRVYGTRAGPNIYRLPVERRSKTAGGAAVKTAGGAAVKTAGGQAVIPTPEPLQGEPLSREVEIVPEWEVFFNHFWDAYPRKVGKPAAKRAMKAKYTEAGRRWMADGTMAWADYWAGSKTDEQFIPHPSTFLNQERYNDTPPALTAPKHESAADIINRIRNRDNL